MTTTGGLAHAIVRHRRWIALGWVVACAVLIPMSRHLEPRLQVAARVNGSESAEVERLLAQRFASPFAHYLVLVVTGVPSPSTAAGDSALREIDGALRRTPGVAGTLSYLDQHEQAFIGARGGGTFVVVGLPAVERADTLLGALRASSESLAVQLRGTHPNVALRWTGELALNADLRRASAADAQTAEARVLPVTLLLLVVAFGTLAAAFVPVVAGVLAISLTLGLTAFVAHAWSLSILLQNVVTMLGLGLGIDYSLLIVGRFREGLRAGLTSEIAAEDACRQSGPTILLSGVAVAIGFAALATTPVNELRSIAVGGLLVVLVSVGVATLLLPGLLAWLGHRIDLGGLPRRLKPRSLTPVGLTPGSLKPSRWAAWARLVVAHPVRVLLLASAPVCTLAWHARELRPELPRGDWLPRNVESAVALYELQAMERAAAVHSVRVLVEFPEPVSALDARGWMATTLLSRRLEADSAVASVRAIPQLVAQRLGFIPPMIDAASVPQTLRDAFVSRDGRAVLIELIPRESATQEQLRMLVQRVRTIDAAAVAGVPGLRVHVGGLPALNTDYADAVAGRFMGVVALVVGATFVVLAIGFRSVLVPLKAIALNLLAVAGAFGAVTYVFQDGVGASLVGLSGPLGGIFPAIPVLVFCIVFGMSMDYEVFLVARVREARRAGLSENDAVAEGLVRTGSLITSAAAIMVVVFGAFTLGSFLLIKMLGFALATAVFLDATVMRLAVSPALLAIGGRWNWWPSRITAQKETVGQLASYSRGKAGDTARRLAHATVLPADAIGRATGSRRNAH